LLSYTTKDGPLARIITFRALAQIEHGRRKLVSRNGNEFKSFRTLCEALGTEVMRSLIIDGEIVCLDGDGKSLFYDLLFRKGQPRFVRHT
jgi:ATP-dependent DNA ligase